MNLKRLCGLRWGLRMMVITILIIINGLNVIVKYGSHHWKSIRGFFYISKWRIALFGLNALGKSYSYDGGQGNTIEKHGMNQFLP
jgi:hypothetical protein